jgi:hypothetical protein
MAFSSVNCLAFYEQVMEDARKHAHVRPLRLSTDWWLAAFVYIWWLIQVEVGGICSIDEQLPKGVYNTVLL